MVNGSSSSSMKKADKGIYRFLPWIMERLGGIETTFGAAFVTVTVNA